MDEVNAKSIILECFTMPPGHRVAAHLEVRQKESGYPPATFVECIKDAFNHYRDNLANEIAIMQANGNEAKDMKVPLLQFDNRIPPGHFLAFSDLPNYWQAIEQFADKVCGVWRIHDRATNESYTYPFDQADIPENLIFEYKKWFLPIPKFQFTDADLMGWQTKYGIFLDSRPTFRPLLLNKGIEFAEINLRHCQQYEPADLHQIDSLQRRIDAAKRMAEIRIPTTANSVTKTDQWGPDDKPLTHHQTAMYLHYIGEAVTRETHGNSIFNKWSHWRNKHYRITPNSWDLKAITQLKHLKTVRDRLVSENKRAEANQCQRDIETLNEKIAKL